MHSKHAFHKSSTVCLKSSLIQKLHTLESFIFWSFFLSSWVPQSPFSCFPTVIPPSCLYVFMSFCIFIFLSFCCFVWLSSYVAMSVCMCVCGALALVPWGRLAKFTPSKFLAEKFDQKKCVILDNTKLATKPRKQKYNKIHLKYFKYT